MKKRVWKGKRLFSLLLAFVMLASIMPLELLVGAISPREEPADISVEMSAEPEKVALNGTSTVTLAVTLADEIDCATIHIQLDEKEVEAIKPFGENKEGDPSAVLLNEGEDSPKVTLDEEKNILEIKTYSKYSPYTVEFPVHYPETLAEGEGAPADELKDFVFSVDVDTETKDIELVDYAWAPNDVDPSEPEDPNVPPTNNSTGEPDGSAPTEDQDAGGDETNTNSDMEESADTPTDVPVTPADETDTSADVPVPPTDEEPEEPGDAAVEGGAVYETVTLAASTGGEEIVSGGNGDGSSEGDGKDQGKTEPTTYFQGVTVIFTNQEEEQAPENPEFMLSLSTDSSITPVDRKLPDFTFTATAKLNEDAVVAEGNSISFQLQIQLPEGITFPEGTYFSEVGNNGITVQYTGTDDTGGEVITIPLPEGVTVENIGASDIAQVSEDLSTLTLSITQSLHASAEQPEGSSWTYAVTVCGSVLEIADGFTSGAISITSAPAQGDDKELAIPVDPVKVELDDSYKFSGRKTFQKTIYWSDNNGEGGMRPETGDFPIPYNVPLQFRIGGEAGQWVTLDESNMAEVGLHQMPELQVSDNMNGVYTLTYEGLNTQRDTISPTDPNEITKSEQIDWQFGAPPVVAGYDPAVVDDGAGNWTYCLLTDFNFTAQLRWGDLGDGTRAEEATKQTFALYKRVGNGDPEQIGTLGNLEAQGKLIDTVIEGSSPIVSSVMITDLPGYTADGMPITYFVDLAEGQTDMELDLEEGILPEADKLTAGFDNTTAPSHSTDTDKLYDGGRLTLTLSGTTHFSAQKDWLDRADPNGRPEATYVLYRYREGTDDPGHGTPLMQYTVHVEPSSEDPEFNLIDVDDEGKDLYKTYDLTILENNDLAVLPKYDQDGYRYVYYLKETLASGEGKNSYKQVFGRVEVDENGDVVYDEETGDPVIVPDTDPLPDNYYGDNRTERDKDDTGVYNGGVLSNQLTRSTQAYLNKTWKASAYQGDLGDVTATFTLQYRPEGEYTDPEDGWITTQTKAVQDNITEENMSSWTASAAVDQFGPLGKKLEYRWIETGITQEGKDIDLGPATYETNEDGDTVRVQTFTLKHGATDVRYRSETVYDPATGETTITNSVEDTLNYVVEKVWDGVEPKPVTFNLYRMVSGSALDENTDPYLTFKWDGTNKNITIKNIKDFPELPGDMFNPIDSEVKDGKTIWNTVINNLPRFNANGQEYEYLLLEVSDENDPHFPTYETTREENGDYKTVVTNGIGGGQRILVRKEWTDDTDMEHRGDVYVQVYKIADDTPVLKQPFQLQEGVLTVEIGLPEGVTRDDVYVLEVRVGDTKVPIQPYHFGDEDGPVTIDDPDANAENPIVNGKSSVYQYTTEHHRYEATYRTTTLEGTNEKIFVVKTAGWATWT